MSIDLNKTINTMRKLFDMNSELWHQFKAIEEKSPLGKDDPEAIRLHGEIVSLNKIYIQYVTSPRPVGRGFPDRLPLPAC